jgi:penicillin-binding protein 1A
MPPSTPKDPSSPKPKVASSPSSPWWKWPLRILMWLLGLAAAGALALALVIAVALAFAYPNLPDISDLADYRPKLPLRIYSSEGALLGEFGEERRNLTPIAEIPKVMKDAVLAIEDTRFFEHGGVDYKGMLRAMLANLGRIKSQGASTITMQVARNVYLSSEKTFTRKIYEILLTFKLEHLLSKNQILEVYMNQIYLGNRAYGFAAASEAYFGKPLKSISVAEAAMLAGLAQGAFGLQPDQQPQAGSHSPAIHHRPHGGERIHHLGRGRCGAQGIHPHPHWARQHTRACRVRGGDGPPTHFCAVRQRGLHTRPECLHHTERQRPGCGLQRSAPRHHEL